METPNTDLTPKTEDQEEVVTLTKAQVEEMKSYEQRYKDSQKEWEVLAHIKKTKDDNGYLLQLAEKNPKMAEKVAEHWDLSLDEAIAKIKWEAKEPKTDIKEAVKEAREQEKAEEQLASFIKEKNISGEFLEDFQSEFDDYMEGKKWTAERVAKATRYALSEAKKVSKFAEQYKEVEWKRADLWGKWGSPETKGKTSWIIQQWKDQNSKNQALWDKHNLLKNK